MGASLVLVALAATVIGPSDRRLGAAGAAAFEDGYALHDHEAHDHSDPSQPGYDLGSHEQSEGLVLVTDETSSDRAGAFCATDAPVRSYDVVAIAIDITLNRYLDHDPQGRMYVLEGDLGRARAEERQNTVARSREAESAVSIGLQGDAIQPLTLRVNAGECLRIQLRNAIEDEPASLHLHGSALYVASDGSPAIAANPRVIAASGETVVYEWMVAGDEPEGTHYFHSQGDTRRQTSHGLFGAVIVEPSGSVYLDPSNREELRSGWSAIVRGPDGASFREFAIYYHEIGDESYQLLNVAGEFVPQVDPFTNAYRPSARALNYRSEPFLNRLKLQDEQNGFFDESAAYSSYSFGDPATPILRAYLGDPAKQRVIHGGSEVFHVHHVHGGTTRWRRQPGVEEAAFAAGLEKHPPLLPEASERIDSQTIGPSETFDVEPECASGGCQQSAGDFLLHCHVAHHYLAGMWTFWRVYNTLQDGEASTDAMPALLELPGRGGVVAPAVTSTDLVGTTVDWSGKSFRIGADDLSVWVEGQLPPPGQPLGHDASVLDWTRQGALYLNEQETTAEWPGYRSPAPATRPPILFDPQTGKLAYPMLRPHLGKRPPFAPGHGPAPFLDPGGGRDPPQPGASGPASLCPTGTQVKQFAIHAITLPITLSQRDGLLDPRGQIFVLKQQEDQVRADNDLRVPLAIRANAGQDCIDIVLKSELRDSPESHFFSKVNVHIHFVQFDVQASDGVPTGFGYEQAVRPFTVEGETVVADVEAGDSMLRLSNTGRFQPGVLVGVGMDQDETFEVARIAEIRGNEVLLDAPLRHAHAAQEIVSTEFVRYRWYPDVQFGTAYFHDHVNALATWRHGLFGALIAEPPGSTYHDPETGAEVESGPIADIHAEARVSVDVTGSFRELVLFVQDDNPLTHVGRSTGSSYNLRVEPLDARGGDPARYFSSSVHGDPETPLLRAYRGDPIVIRALVSATNDVHTLHVDGHWFRIEPFSDSSRPTSTVRIGISERQDVVIPAAGGPQNRAGDYLYYSGRELKLREGSWGIIRVLEPGSGESLLPLPGRAPPPGAGPVCPGGAPQKSFTVAAIGAPLPMLGGDNGRLFVLQQDKPAVLQGERTPEPLVLHVNVGDCIQVELSNELPSAMVSFHVDMLAYDPMQSGGVEAGFNPPGAVAPGEARTFTYFAHPQVGETTALVRDWGDVVSSPALGLYGAIVVGPPGATYRDPVTGLDVSTGAGWAVNVYPTGADPYRDFTVFLQDEDATLGTHRMPYRASVQGVVGLNYRAEPLEARLDEGGSTADVFRSDVHGDPATPVMEAFTGDGVRIHVLSPSSEQAQVFAVEGHRWPVEPGREGTDLISSVSLGGLEALTLELDGGAGGRTQQAGDYLYGDHREPYREAGMWGILRVYDPGGGSGSLLLLSCGTESCVAGDLQVMRWALFGVALVVAAFVGGLLFTRRRSEDGSR